MLTRIECDALRGVANYCAFAPRCRAKPHKGWVFFAMSARPRRARCGRRRVRGVRGSTLCVHVVEYHTTTRDDVRCHETLCNLLEINTTSRLFITEMVTRSALLVCGPARPAPGRLGERFSISAHRTSSRSVRANACRRKFNPTPRADAHKCRDEKTPSSLHLCVVCSSLRALHVV